MPPTTRFFSGFLVCLCLGASTGLAIERAQVKLKSEIQARLTPVPTFLSGTMSPFSLSVDGKVLVRLTGPVSGLSVNGELVKPSKEEHSPFAYRTAADRVDVIYSPEGQPEKLLSFMLPVMGVRKLGQTSILFGLQGKIGALTIDGKPVKTTGDTALWPLPKEDGIKRTHVAELRSPAGKTGRIYNLQLVQDSLVISREERREIAWVPPGLSTQLTLFELAAVGTIQSQYGSSFSGEVAWTPAVWFSDAVAIRGNFGFEPVSRSGGVFFLALDDELLLDFPFSNRVLLEVGGGFETWIHYGGTRPMASTNLVFRSDFGIIDRFLLGYSAIFDTNFTHMPHLGIGFRL